MIWVVAGAIGAGLVGWRWGLRGLIAAVAAVWLAGSPGAVCARAPEDVFVLEKPIRPAR